MYHQNIVLACQRHNTLKKGQFHALGCRIAGKTQNHHFGLGNGLPHGFFNFLEKIHAGDHGHRTNIGTGNNGTIDMNGVTGIGHQHSVALVQRCQHQVGQAFFGTDGNDRFTIRIQVHIVAALVPIGHGAAQTRDAFGDRISMSVRAGSRLDQLFHDVRRCRSVWVPHGHINNVLATTAGGHFQLASNIEHVRRQTLDARKANHGIP